MVPEASVPLVWRRIQSRYRLLGAKCSACDKIIFPPRHSCPDCKNPTQTGVPLSGKGRILVSTTVYSGTRDMNLQVPYSIAIIELEEGMKLTSQIVGILPEEVKPGMKVKMAFRKLGAASDDSVIRYGYKFTPEEYPVIPPEIHEPED